MPTTVSLPCLICAAPLEFPAGSRAVLCPICEDERPLPLIVPDEVPACAVGSGEPFEAAIEDRFATRCPGCSVIVSAPRSVRSCPHCGQRRPDAAAHEPVMLTHGRLPFLLDENAARVALRTELTRLALTSAGPLEPLYLPWLLVSAQARAVYEGRVGFEIEEPGPHGTTTIRIEWAQAVGEVERSWDNQGGCASLGLPEEIGRRLLPWDFAFTEPYAAEELAAIPVEHIRRDPASVFAWAVPRFREELRQAARENMVGQRREVKRVDPSLDERVRLILVPVWMGRTSSGARFAVNARTAEVVVMGHAGLEIEEADQALEPYRGRGLRLGLTVLGVTAVVGMVLWLMLS